MGEECDNYISNENYEKLRNYLSKLKELNQIVLQKELFASIKGHLYLIKGYLDNPEGQVEVELPLIGSYFWQVSFILTKKNFFSSKMTLLTKRPIPDPLMLYLSKIDLDNTHEIIENC